MGYCFSKFCLGTAMGRTRKTSHIKVKDLLTIEMNKGLSRTQNKNASLKMFITYVRNLPKGTERGKYMALDLGGTNFRVLSITLADQGISIENKIYALSEKLMTGPGAELFVYIADCIAGFLADNNAGQFLPLGFTFSFPCKQQGLAVGKLVTWTKGFKCSGVVDHDVVQLLNQALQNQALLKRKNTDVRCVALINDTVGCLMSCALIHPNTYIGVIIGTGTNACYVESLDRVELWDGDKLEPKQVVINTEWGAFGDDGALKFIQTQIDKDIDKHSLNPRHQTLQQLLLIYARACERFEKMISGMYLGEIARRIIVSCVNKRLLFGGHLSQLMSTPHRFQTKYLSAAEKDDASIPNQPFPNTRKILEEMGVSECTVEDCSHVHRICQAVSQRSAYLVAAAIASLIDRVNRPSVTVGIDGSLYRFHPQFHEHIMRMVKKLINCDCQVQLILSEDGSGKGAAVVAAAAVANPETT